MNAANKGASMRFFNVGNEKTRLTFPDKNGRQKTELMDAGVLWSELNSAADWVNGPRGVAADKKVAEELETNGDFSFPPLTAIVASPVFDADGSLIAVPGYHAKSGSSTIRRRTSSSRRFQSAQRVSRRSRPVI